jgi:hypothetical protein
MPIKCLALFPYDFTQPLADYRAVHIIVISPAFVTGVVGWVNVNTFNLTRVIREQGLERNEVVPLDNEVAFSRLTARQFRYIFQKVKRDLVMVVYDSFLTDPVQSGHYKLRLIIQREKSLL